MFGGSKGCVVIEGPTSVGSNGLRIEEDDWDALRAALVNWIARSASVKEEPGDSEDEVYVHSGIVGSEFMVDDFVDQVFPLQDGISHKCNAIPPLPVSFPTRQGIETLSTRKFIQQAFVTHMLHNKHTRSRAPEASHDNIINLNDLAFTLPPSVFRRQEKVPICHVCGSL